MAWRTIALGYVLGLCLGLSSAWAASSSALSYTLRYSLSTPNILHVQLEFSVPSAGEWRLRLGAKDGFVRHACWELPPLVLLSAEDAAGRPLPLEKDSRETSSCERLWRFRTEEAGTVRIRYWLYDSKAPLTTDYRSFSRPIINQGFIHIIGFESLLYPEQEFKTSASEIRLSLEVSPKAPDKWAYFGNSGTSSGAFPWRFAEPLPNFLARVFAFGEFSQTRFQGVAGQTVVITPGRDQEWRVRELSESAARLWKAAETLFGGTRNGGAPTPLRLISFLQTAEGKRGLLPITALHLPDSIVICVNPNAAPSSALDATLKEELAHEIAHSYTLHLLTNKAEPWLKEGLAEFYGKRLMRRAGLWTADEEQASWERLLREALTTPYAKATLDTAQKRFWVDAAWHRLAYARGALAFYWLDRYTPAGAESRQNLDDYVKNWHLNGIRLDTSTSLCQPQSIPDCNTITSNINKITNGSSGFADLFRFP